MIGINFNKLYNLIGIVLCGAAGSIVGLITGGPLGAFLGIALGIGCAFVLKKNLARA